MKPSPWIGAFALLVSLALGSCQDRQTPEAPPASPSEPPAIVSGTLHLEESVRHAADPLSVLFVIARNERGQIVAVKKLLPPFQWPVDFRLTESDVMIAGTELSGKLKLSARLDEDGNANPAASGDILGAPETEWVEAGAKGIRIRLGEIVP